MQDDDIKTDDELEDKEVDLEAALPEEDVLDTEDDLLDGKATSIDKLADEEDEDAEDEDLFDDVEAEDGY